MRRPDISPRGSAVKLSQLSHKLPQLFSSDPGSGARRDEFYARRPDISPRHTRSRERHITVMEYSPI